MRHKLIFFMMLIALLFAACSVPSPQPTVTPTPPITATFTATATSTPKSPTQEITHVSRLDWYGLPIMPGAMEGKSTGVGYEYLIDASFTEVANYYVTVLTAEQWILVSFEPNTHMMVFERDGKQIQLMTVYFPNNNATKVFLIWINKK